MKDVVLSAVLSGSVLVGSACADGIVCDRDAYLGVGAYDGIMHDIQIVDSIAYVAAGSDGLLIFDVSDPASMQQLSQFDTPDSAVNLDVFQAGSTVRVFVADESGGVQIITATDPASPTLWTVLPVADARDVALHEPGVGGSLRVSIAAGSEGYIAYSIASVFNISQVETESTGGSARKVLVESNGVDEFVHVLSQGPRSVTTFQVGNTASSDLLHTINYATSIDDIAMKDNVLFVSLSNNRSVDVHEFDQGRTSSSLEDNLTLPERAYGLTASGDLLLTATDDFRLMVSDIASPINPNYHSTLHVPGPVRASGVSGDVMFVGVGSTGLVAVDGSDPDRFDVSDLILGSYDWADSNLYEANEIVVDGNTAAIARPDLHLFDVSTDVPMLASVYSVGDDVAGLDGRDGLLYLAMADEFRVLDVSDPMSPSLTGSLSMPLARDVYLHEQGGTLYAFVAAGSNGMHIVDVSDPMLPVVVGTYATSVSVDDVLTIGDTLFGPAAFITEDVATVTLVPLANLTNPAALSSYQATSAYVFEMIVDGDYGYLVVSGDFGFAKLEVVDLSQPLAPVIVSEESVGGYASNLSKFSMHQVDGILMIDNVESGFTFIDTSDPSDPVYVGSSSIFRNVLGSTLVGDRLYVRSPEEFHVVEMSGCAVPCPADLTGDGSLDFFDVSAFLAAFGAMDPIADFTGDGTFDFFDVSAFLSAFGAGCP